jgi:hypothetical protein
MSPKLPAIAAVVFFLSACATCRDHPAMCAIASAAVIGCVAATSAAHHHSTVEPVRDWYLKDVRP